MAPLMRIVMRYVIGVSLGYFVTKGVIPQELGDQILADDATITAIQTGLCVGAGVCVETAYGLAKKRGWSL